MRGEAAHHLGRVLRAETGQLYELSDGEHIWLARTENVMRNEIRFALVEQLPTAASSVRIDLLLAIVKFDRFEWALEKATELGAERVIPLATERSERGLIAAAGKRVERWKRILLESAQQTRRLRVPELCAATQTANAFGGTVASIKVLLSEKPEAMPLRDILEPIASTRMSGNPVHVAIAIGPEGGWTETEFASARISGFTEAGLGSNILRTETAVCAACAAAQYAFGESQT